MKKAQQILLLLIFSISVFITLLFALVLIWNSFFGADIGVDKYEIDKFCRSFGAPVVTTELPKLSGDVKQIVHDGSRIYILYRGEPEMDGVIQVYSYDGHYICSLLFYCHVNGGFRLSTADNTLYVSDFHGNIYVLENLELTSLVLNDQSDAWNALHFELDWDTWSDKFLLRGSDIYVVGGEKCIIENAAKDHLFILIEAILVAVLGIFSFAFWRLTKKLKREGAIIR